MVLLLIQEPAGLLPFPQIYLKREAVLCHLDPLGDVTPQQLDLFVQPFQLADGNVVTGDDAGRIEDVPEGRHDLLTTTIHTGGKKLQRQVIAVSVHHQTRQKIALAIHGTEGGQAGVAGLAVSQSGGNPPFEECHRVDILPNAGIPAGRRSANAGCNDRRR